MIISAAVAIAEARMGKPGEKYYSGRSRAIMERAYIAFKSSTWMIVISGFVEPVLFLLSFGYGLKDLVGDITVAGQPVGYVAFIAPALLATSAMNGAIYDSTMNVFFKLNHDRIYHGMLSTSLGPMDVALGEIGWALLRGFSYAVGFMALVTPLGLIPSAWGILAIPAAVLIAFGFASFGMAVTSYMKSFQQLEVVNIILLPMTLFSGSLYPISVYPDWVEKIIMALPLWHGIELVRAFWFGNLTSGVFVHIAYFLVMIAAGLFVTSRRLRALFLR